MDGGVECPEVFEERVQVNCLVSGWSVWSDILNDGTFVRTRHIVPHPANGESECPKLLETEERGPVDCLVSEWSGWSGPVMDTFVRTRNVTRNPTNGGSECPKLLEVDERVQVVTVEETAESFAASFLYNPAFNGRRRRQTNEAPLRDLLVIFDESGSIGRGNFDTATDQIPRLLRTLCPRPNPFDGNIHKLAAISYSSSVREQFEFDTYDTTDDAIDAIRQTPYHGGGTNTAAAFTFAETLFDNARGARLGDTRVTQEVLILTDGKSNNGEAAIAAAKELQGTAEIFALVIGTYSKEGKEELLQYVSPPTANHIFSVPNFDKLTDLVTKVEEIVSGIECMPFDLN